MLAFQEHLVLKAFVLGLSKNPVCQNIDGKGDPRVGFLFFLTGGKRSVFEGRLD